MKGYVGVDIGGTKMYMLACAEGEYVEKKVPTGKMCTTAYIKEQLEIFLEALPFEVEGIGMALPGLIQNEDTLQLSDVLPRLNGMKATELEKRREIKFINDVKAATLCEASYYPDSYTGVVIMVGTGIAMGVWENGQILQGAEGFAGELGNAVIPYKGEMATFDNLSGGAAILEKVGCSAEELHKKLEVGDEKASQVIQEAGYCFGIALGLVIQLYNPQVIVIGGSTTTYLNYLKVAKETAKQHTLPELFDRCQFMEPKDREKIVALGAIQAIKENA